MTNNNHRFRFHFIFSGIHPKIFTLYNMTNITDFFFFIIIIYRVYESIVNIKIQTHYFLFISREIIKYSCILYVVDIHFHFLWLCEFNWFQLYQWHFNDDSLLLLFFFLSVHHSTFIYFYFILCTIFFCICFIEA